MASPVSHPHATQFVPPYSDVRKGALQITHDLFTDKLKDLVKGNILAGKWLLQAISTGQLHLKNKNKIEVVKKIKIMNGTFETGKEILGSAEVPEKTMKAIIAMQKLGSSFNARNTQGVVK